MSFHGGLNSLLFSLHKPASGSWCAGGWHKGPQTKRGKGLNAGLLPSAKRNHPKFRVSVCRKLDSRDDNKEKQGKSISGAILWSEAMELLGVEFWNQSRNQKKAWISMKGSSVLGNKMPNLDSECSGYTLWIPHLVALWSHTSTLSQALNKPWFSNLWKSL